MSFKEELAREYRAWAQTIGEKVGTCGVSENIMDEVWTKFVLNCGGNLLAAITSWG